MRAPSTARRPTTSAVPRWRCTGSPSRNGASAKREMRRRRSIRAAGMCRSGATSQSPRRGSAPSGNDPAMLTAQRSPAAAVSIVRFCACNPRTRSAMPPGLSTSRSPIATAPAVTVPVTTRPIPGRLKARSIGIRNKPAGGPALRTALAARAFSCRCRIRAAMPSPVRLDTGKIGRPAYPAAASNSSTSPTTAATRSGSTRSILVTTPVISATPIRSRMSRCSMVCGRGPSSAATTSNTRSIDSTPASMLGRNRSWPGTSTKPSSVPSGKVA